MIENKYDFYHHFFINTGIPKTVNVLKTDNLRVFEERKLSVFEDEF